MMTYVVITTRSWLWPWQKRALKLLGWRGAGSDEKGRQYFTLALTPDQRNELAGQGWIYRVSVLYLRTPKWQEEYAGFTIHRPRKDRLDTQLAALLDTIEYRQIADSSFNKPDVARFHCRVQLVDDKLSNDQAAYLQNLDLKPRPSTRELEEMALDPPADSAQGRFTTTSALTAFEISELSHQDFVVRVELVSQELS